MNTFNITGVDVLRFQIDGGVIGFGEYGISTDPFTMNFSTPSGLGYTFLDNLDPIAFLNEDQFQLLGNTGNANPSFVAKEYLVLPHSQGTLGQSNGAIRKVGDDVIIGSGNILVNLTTLSAGGADNLGDHLTTQPLDMNSVLQNPIINFTSMSSFLGHSHFWTPDGMVWNLASLSSDSYSWLGGGSTEMMTLTNSQLNVHNKRITNVSNPTSPLDAVNLQTLNTGFVTTNTNQTTGLSGNKVWTGAHIFDSALTQILGSINLGGAVGDFFTVNGRFLSPLIPFLNGTALGTSSQRCDVLASDLSLQNGGISVNTISNISTTDNSFSLMTASAIQDAIIAGAGGGSFVTTNTSQTGLSGSKTWTGVHTFNAGLTVINGSLTLGNSVADLFNVTGRFLSPLIPLSDGIDLGSTSQRWDLFGQNMSLASGSTVANISNSSTQSSSSALMTASAIQSAISAGGGSFVTTNTTQTNLSGSKTWTGAHRFTSVVNFDGSVALGNSSSDILISNGRWFTPLIPNTDGVNLGSSSQRWDVFAQNLNLALGATVGNISTSSGATGNSVLMTATAIQNAISAGAGGVSIGDNPLWTGFHQWTNTATFQSVLNVQGTLNLFGTLDHNGSLIGFRNKTPISAPNYTVSGTLIDRTISTTNTSVLEVSEVLATVVRDLIAVGIFR